MRMFLAAVLLVLAPGLARAQTSPPNIILIFADDLGYADVGCFGAQGFKTPNLDQMAKEGIRFTNFYSGCAVCSGSRAALLTGRHYQRTGVVPVMFPGTKVGLNPNEITVAALLKRLGYRTYIIGKWHLGHMPKYLPTRHGFDAFYGLPYSNDMAIDPANAKFAKDCVFREGQSEETARKAGVKNGKVPLMRGDEVVEFPADQKTLSRRYAEEAVKVIGANKDQPFFLYMPTTMPHVPLWVSDEFKGRTKTVFGDVMEELDDSIGKVLKAVKDNGLEEKTLVIFTSDNGAHQGSAAPLRGRKATVYEGGVREPTIMRWVGKISAGGQCDEVAATIDLLPTLAKLGGGEAPTDRPIDGKDIRPLMFEKGAKSPHEMYILPHGPGAVRAGQWKFYPWAEGSGTKAKKDEPKKKDVNTPKTQLYDLTKDIGETRNVADEHPEVVARLQRAYDEFLADVKKNKLPAE